MPERLPTETFDIPAAEIRSGYRTAVYFNRAKQIAAHHIDRDVRGVTMQYFQRNRDTVLCGIDEALGVLRVGAGRWTDERGARLLFEDYLREKWGSRSQDRARRHLHMKNLLQIEDELDSYWQSEFDLLEVKALFDGDIIQDYEPVMHVKGPYSAFAHLESPMLGVMARRSLIATNTRRVVDAANGKQVLFFADRFDHWATQGGDGYSARIGGATGFASDAHAAWWGDHGIGTSPHALIAFFNGDLIAAMAAFMEDYPDVPLIPLVDFHNNCVVDAVRVLRAFGEKLWGVRLDTSGNMTDHWFEGRPDRLTIAEKEDGYYPRLGDFKPTGVNPQLVRETRRLLDLNGGEHVRIVVSGGFNPTRIADFEREKVPVDVYAVGSSLLRGENDFTADIVVPAAKEGRWFRPSDRLQPVT